MEKRVVGPGFHAQVFAIVRRVPRGRVTTYGDVAKLLGSSRVARHVGYALAACMDRKVPWHRVVNGRGTPSPGADPTRPARQQSLLEKEGVRFDARGRIDLRLYRWVTKTRPRPRPR